MGRGEKSHKKTVKRKRDGGIFLPERRGKEISQNWLPSISEICDFFLFSFFIWEDVCRVVIVFLARSSLRKKEEIGMGGRGEKQRPRGKSLPQHKRKKWHIHLFFFFSRRDFFCPGHRNKSASSRRQVKAGCYYMCIGDVADRSRA